MEVIITNDDSNVWSVHQFDATRAAAFRYELLKHARYMEDRLVEDLITACDNEVKKEP